MKNKKEEYQMTECYEGPRKLVIVDSNGERRTTASAFFGGLTQAGVLRTEKYGYPLEAIVCSTLFEAQAHIAHTGGGFDYKLYPNKDLFGVLLSATAREGEPWPIKEKDSGTENGDYSAFGAAAKYFQRGIPFVLYAEKDDWSRGDKAFSTLMGIAKLNWPVVSCPLVEVGEYRPWEGLFHRLKKEVNGRYRKITSSHRVNIALTADYDGRTPPVIVVHGPERYHAYIVEVQFEKTHTPDGHPTGRHVIGSRITPVYDQQLDSRTTC